MPQKHKWCLKLVLGLCTHIEKSCESRFNRDPESIIIAAYWPPAFFKFLVTDYFKTAFRSVLVINWLSSLIQQTFLRFSFPVRYSSSLELDLPKYFSDSPITSSTETKLNLDTYKNRERGNRERRAPKNVNGGFASQRLNYQKLFFSNSAKYLRVILDKKQNRNLNIEER